MVDVGPPAGKAASTTVVSLDSPSTSLTLMK